MNSISLATSAMLVEINISCWSAKKLARKESDELTSAKSAAKRAAQVHKNLLADDVRLASINKYAAEIRNWLARVTVPWSDSGLRLISTAQFMDFKQELDFRKSAFDALVADFVTMYPTLISAQAFKLGNMFNRDEYPAPDEVASKFAVSYSFSPVPEVGDFRVDIAADIKAAIEAEYAEEYARRVDAVNREHWGRLKDVLDKISDRLGCDTEGKNKVFRDTLIENALDVCDLLRLTNVTNDPVLEKARYAAEQSLLDVTPKELRENEAIRDDLKARVDDILSKFDF
jgi:hypothetical protein